MALSRFRPATGTPPCSAPRTSNRCFNPLTTTITIRGQALRHLGYRVLETSESSTALNILVEHSEIALLLTDVGLPGLNGRQLAEEARRRVPRLKVVYMTGYARNAIVHHGVLDAGVDLLAKPFTTEGLGRKLQEALRRD
jgi:CheY-like chemotaxis protein